VTSFLQLILILLGLVDPPADIIDTSELGKPRACVSTIFGMKSDKWAGGNALYLGRPIDPKVDIGIAHRALPVGSLVVLQNPKKPTKMLVAQVMDRGPYGALLKEGEVPNANQVCKRRKKGLWCVKRKRKEPGKWRGCIDTTPRAAELLEHNGYQRIKYWPIPNTAPDSVWDWPAYQKKGRNI
jgi:hypothetical protein